MGTNHLRFLMALLVVTMCLIALPSNALAGQTSIGEIPVTISIGGSPPRDHEDYKIILEADDPDYPMPEGSVKGIFSMIIRGENTVNLPQINFSSLGIYTYRIYQKVGTNELATYDSTVYNLTVSVINAEEGSGLETSAILYKGSEKDKTGEVVFQNDYDPQSPSKSPTETEKPKTGDNTVIWPYIGLFIGGAGILLILGLTIKNKSKSA